MKSEMVIPRIISHIRRDANVVSCQSNEEHSLGVANLTKKFAAAFGMAEWGYVLGLLHDKGKKKKQFQEYIRDVNGIQGYTDYSQEGKKHAYVGAVIARQLYGDTALPFLCNQIASHHSGLHDYCDIKK